MKLLQVFVIITQWKNVDSTVFQTFQAFQESEIELIIIYNIYLQPLCRFDSHHQCHFFQFGTLLNNVLLNQPYGAFWFNPKCVLKVFVKSCTMCFLFDIMSSSFNQEVRKITECINLKFYSTFIPGKLLLFSGAFYFFCLHVVHDLLFLFWAVCVHQPADESDSDHHSLQVLDSEALVSSIKASQTETWCLNDWYQTCVSCQWGKKKFGKVDFEVLMWVDLSVAHVFH